MTVLLDCEERLVEASPWSDLRSRFLESLDAADRAHIFDLSAHAAQRLELWAAHYPVIREVRIRPLVLSVAAAAPFSDVEALVSTSRLSLWVFTLDDLFDEEALPEADLLRRAERYRAIARGESVNSTDDVLGVALGEVRANLARYPLFDTLGAVWARALQATIDEMIRENQWRQVYRNASQRGSAVVLPTYEEYLATGLYSIGGPPHIWAALITIDDASTPHHLAHLRLMEQLASTCIRLANDLQSSEKEVAEGKVNALVILSQALRQGGLSGEAARQWAEARIRADIGRGLDDLARLQATGGTLTG